MTEYETKHETVRGEVYKDGEMKSVSETIDIPENAIGVNTTAITSSPVMVAVTYLVPKGDDDG